MSDDSGEIFALGIGHLTALQNCQDFVLLDHVTKPLAQFSHRARQFHGDARNPVPIGNDGAGNDDTPRQRGGADGRDFDMRRRDTLIGKLDDRVLFIGRVLAHSRVRGLSVTRKRRAR